MSPSITGFLATSLLPRGNSPANYTLSVNVSVCEERDRWSSHEGRPFTVLHQVAARAEEDEVEKRHIGVALITGNVKPPKGRGKDLKFRRHNPTGRR